ncbi:MAG: alpha/beta hydrolase [Pseudomonadota bacterium]
MMRRAALRRSTIEERWPPIGQMIEVDGLKVHYWEQGTGQPVVLIHGASGNLRDFTFDLAPRLAKTCRVIAFDRPGFGHSDRLREHGWDPRAQAAHLAAATRALGVEQPVVLGHSWGGAVAMAWAVAESETLKGVVSVSGATMPWGGALATYYSFIASDVVGRPVSWLIHKALSEKRMAGLVAEAFAPQPTPDRYADYIGVPLATRPATLRGNARDITELNTILEALSLSYARITCPVEILHGTADDTVPLKIHAEHMHALLPKSHLTRLEGVGHMPHHARPEDVEAAIRRLSEN